MANNKKGKQNPINPHRPNVPGALQNVLIAGLNKGQLLGMAFAVILIILILRYPQDQLPSLLDNLLCTTLFNSILGYVLAGVVTFGAFYINKRQRHIHTKEIRRISNEKKKLQEQIQQKKLPSSN